MTGAFYLFCLSLQWHLNFFASPQICLNSPLFLFIIRFPFLPFVHASCTYTDLLAFVWVNQHSEGIPFVTFKWLFWRVKFGFQTSAKVVKDLAKKFKGKELGNALWLSVFRNRETCVCVRMHAQTGSKLPTRQDSRWKEILSLWLACNFLHISSTLADGVSCSITLLPLLPTIRRHIYVCTLETQTQPQSHTVVSCQSGQMSHP